MTNTKRFDNDATHNDASATVLQQALFDSFELYKPHMLGKRIWLACSGGRDSLSLAHLCLKLYKAGRLPFLPQLLHVNHNMQHANTAWATQVLSWAKHNQIPCQVIEINLAKKTEQEARHERYQAMLNVMNHGDVLLLGHHQDDQVETLLMRLFNGAGVNGLSAMKAWSIKQSKGLDTDNLIINNKSIYLWRPLLTVSREQITEYASQQKLVYIDDPTNVALEDNENSGQAQLNDRAWLRSVLMPYIIQRYPTAKQSIARTSVLMQQASLTIDELTVADLKQVTLTNDADTPWYSVLDITQLISLSAARQSALLHRWLAPNTTELPPSKQLVDEVLKLVHRQNSDHQTCLYFDSGVFQYQIRRYQSKLYRISKSWEQWLQLLPDSQQFDLSDKSYKTTNTLCLKQSNLSQLKQNFNWYLIGLSKLIEVLQQQLSLGSSVELMDLSQTELSQTELSQTDLGQIDLQQKAQNDLQQNDLKQPILQKPSLQSIDLQKVEVNRTAKLRFQPLPRDQKIALLNRTGRKSGKKLLQALGQPSFMRQSVILCSLILPPQSQQHQQMTVQTISHPLILITPDQLWVLQSEFAPSIKALIVQSELTTQIQVHQ